MSEIFMAGPSVTDEDLKYVMDAAKTGVWSKSLLLC